MSSQTAGWIEGAVALLSGLLGGGFLTKIGGAWLARRKQKKLEQGELTLQILDDGADLRHSLLEQVEKLRVEVAAATERAHQSEVKLAKLETEHAHLMQRLERKDERTKALRNQLESLGAKPVVDPEVTKA